MRLRSAVLPFELICC